PVPEPRPSDAEWSRFRALELVRAAGLFAAAGDHHDFKIFLLQLAEAAKQPVDFALIAAYAEQQHYVDVAITVSRRSIEAGMPLMVHGYPITALPSGGIVEHPLLLAVVRTESGF